MMTSPDLTIPAYSFSHSRPVVGFGNFGWSESDNKDFFFDPNIVETKFQLWDKVVNDNLLSHSDPLVRAKAVSLLNDKTIMAYAYLKFDGKPVKMLHLQDAILSDTHDRVLFCGCNQHIGKSFTLNVDAATEFLKDHGKNWIGILVSGSLDQSKFQMDRIKMLLRSSQIDYKEEETKESKTGKKDNVTQLSYTFYSSDRKTPLYRNLLICCPHTSSALGYPANVLWFDEFDFWENCDQTHFLYQIAIPRTFRTKGQIKIYTNPDGRDKMMFNLWTQKLPDGSPAWHRYHFNYWDKPGCSQKEFDKLIIGMTKQRVESTLLGQFTRSTGSLFSSEEIRDMYDKELAQKGDSAGFGRETAWFLDVGSSHDQSVLVGAYLEDNPDAPEIPLIKVFYIHKYPQGYPLARVVGVELESSSEDGWEDEAVDNPSVKDVLEKYKEVYDSTSHYPLFGFDATGNAGMLPLFQSVNIDAVDVILSGKKKWHMYQRFQYYAQQRFLKRGLERDDNTLNGKGFDYQLSKLVVKKGTTTSYRQVHHENEDDFDDVPDAVAGVIHLIENPDLSSLDFGIVEHPSIVRDRFNNPHDPETDSMEDQYIPSFYKKAEFNDWVNKKMNERS